MEVRIRKDEILNLETEANAWNRTPFCLFETGRKLRVQVVGFLDSNFQERVGNSECRAATCRVAVITPRLLDGLRLALRAYCNIPWIDGRRLGNRLILLLRRRLLGGGSHCAIMTTFCVFVNLVNIPNGLCTILRPPSIKNHRKR